MSDTSRNEPGDASEARDINPAADALNPFQSPAPLPESQRPTNVRYRIVGISVLMAFILYLDRVCLGEIVKTDMFRSDLGLGDTAEDDQKIGSLLGAFFFTYALFQVPAGWISDRFGARGMLTFYILIWSVLTGITGLIATPAALLLARLGVGAAQAGAYPTSSAVIRRWIRLERRGQASALVSFGGRLGATLAPLLTAGLIIGLGGWRPALWIYGIFGMLVAAAYWWIVRDRPLLHPDCNQEERDHIGRVSDDQPPRLTDVARLLAACCTSRSLWLNSLGQFSINIGWAFLITWLPTYLKKAKGMSDAEGALMVSIVLAMGMAGQLIGGPATDFSVRRFGLRIGRVLPITIACFIAGFAYLCCLVLDSAYAIVACCAVVSLMTDVGNPSIWGFMQDVGGRNTASIFGWANMWGNFGAAVSARMVPFLVAYGASTGSGQAMVFIACASAFFVAGLAALGMDATRPLSTSRQVAVRVDGTPG